MGKTAVVTCLVLARPLPPSEAARGIRKTTLVLVQASLRVCRAAERRAADPRTRSCRGHSSESKTPTPTLCTCVGSRGMQNTLVQQWADEIRKFAPHLKVMTADDRSHLVRSLSAPPFSSYTLGEHVAGVLQLQQPKELQRAVPRRFRCGHQAPQALLWHVLLLAALAPKLDF